MNIFSKTKTQIQRFQTLVMAGVFMIPGSQFLGSGAAVAVATVAGVLAVAPEAEARYGTVRRTSRRTSRRVARRTSRRLAVLPVGARPVYVGGASYYYASGAYWQPVPQGNTTVYVEVVFD